MISKVFKINKFCSSQSIKSLVEHQVPIVNDTFTNASLLYKDYHIPDYDGSLFSINNIPTTIN